MPQTYYVVRSHRTGQYLIARPSPDSTDQFLLLFAENHDALSYLHTHAPGSQDRATVESISTTTVQNTLHRWQLTGVGIVEDPLIPHIQFLKWETQ